MVAMPTGISAAWIRKDASRMIAVIFPEPDIISAEGIGSGQTSGPKSNDKIRCMGEREASGERQTPEAPR
jgi:hypothetical protein